MMERCKMTSNENGSADEHKIDFYGDPRIASGHGKVPGWLKFLYVTLPIVGIIGYCLFWNGSWGWFDRGYWGELQRAANTTYPTQNNTFHPIQKEDGQVPAQ